MAHVQLEKRYKQWCRNAARGDIQPEMLDGRTISIRPLDRNVSSTALVLRDDQDRVLPLRTLSFILRETARRIDANADSLAKTTTPKNADLMVVESKTLMVCLADLCSHEDETKGRHGLGIHLLPFTIGNWVAGIHVPDDTKSWKTNEDKLIGIIQQLWASNRFRYVVVHQSYADLSRRDTNRKRSAQSMLHFKEKKDAIMNVLGEDLDSMDATKASDPNIVGLYLCRKSMIEWLEGYAHKALKNFGLFSPSTPLGHVLATRLHEASRIYGDKNFYPIQRFAGQRERGPVLREMPNLVNRAQALVRENHGMIQVTQLLERLTRILLKVDGQRDGSKERGMLHNLRHATASRPSNCLVFFLNSTLAGEREDQQAFPPPVLSDFDLQENSSGESKPSWAKSLSDLERMTGHDTIEDMRGSTTVTMAGFPFQCTFVLAHKEGERFYYCPHRFCDRHDAIEHVKTVHQGDGLPSETYAKIAQLDTMLEDTEFGKKMRPVNEVELVRKLGLDEKDPEKLRLHPTLHNDLLKMSQALTQNSRLLSRLEKDRVEAMQQLKSLTRLTENAGTASEAPRPQQLFNALNREITELKKFMLSPAALVKFQDVWNRAKTRKEYITKNMYVEFVAANDQMSWLNRTVGEDARRYKEQVEQLGGVDPGATPAGIPGGGIRVGKSNIIGVLTQDLIEQSRRIETVQDVNEALIATNRKASFQRVVSKYDQDFGASNVIPAATPLLAAKGWDDEDEDGEGEGEREEEMRNEREQTQNEVLAPQQEEVTIQRVEPATETIHVSNPLKRSRPKDKGTSEEAALTSRIGGGSKTASGPSPLASHSTSEIPEKVRVTEPKFPTFLKDTLGKELQHIFEVCNLEQREKMLAMDECKRTLSRAFDPKIRDAVETMKVKGALESGQIRTLMDPLRDRVSVLVLTDPRIIKHPNGVLLPFIISGIALIHRLHQKFTNDDQQLCLLLAKGLCELLQVNFRLSKAGFQVVCEALRIVLLEKIEEGRDGHWNVASSLVEALNANIEGFWDAAFLRRYHKIEDPSHKTEHVDADPEKTYASSDKLPSVEAVAARIRKPRYCETSAMSVSPTDSTSKFPRLRLEESTALIEQVDSAVNKGDTSLVRIKDPTGMDTQEWVRRLVQGNANAADDPHVMCTWFRKQTVTFAESMDEEKHQWLRLARCCICTDPLGSAPFQGWCCLSGASSLDSLVDQALKDESDPTEREARREELRQQLVNKIIAQPNYPSFHFWHRHCKQMEDERRVIQARAKEMKTNQKIEVTTFDECPMCRTKYPRDETTFPSMEAISKRIVNMEREVSALVPEAVTPESPRPMIAGTPRPQATIESHDTTGDDEIQQPMEERESASGKEGNDVIATSGVTPPRAVDVASTGLAYVGGLFQADSGCQTSPLATFPPAPVMPNPEHGLTLYDTMMHASDDLNEQVERALEETPMINVPMTSVASIPENISDINELLNDTVFNFDDTPIDDGNELLAATWTLQYLERHPITPLAQNIEASASHQDQTMHTHADTDQAQPLEPVAAMVDDVPPVDSDGGSGPCGQNCIACPFMTPRTNRLGAYRLTTRIDCLSKDVIYVSICRTCAKVNGMGYAITSMRSTVVELQAKSRVRVTNLSKCPLNHDPTIIGLEQGTKDDDDLMNKGSMWKSRFRAMSILDLMAI